MSCPGIPNFDRITVNNLEKEYNKLTVQKKAQFKTCLQQKYSSFSTKCDVLPDLLSVYDNKLERNATAIEKNEQSRQQYINDVFYLFFKVILFIILGIFYYLFIKTPQNAIDSIKGITDLTKETMDNLKVNPTQAVGIK